MSAYTEMFGHEYRPGESLGASVFLIYQYFDEHGEKQAFVSACMPSLFTRTAERRFVAGAVAGGDGGVAVAILISLKISVPHSPML